MPSQLNITPPDYPIRALSTAKSSGYNPPPFTFGPNPNLVSTATTARVTTAGITCNRPATTSTGNLLVAILVHTTSTATYTPPADWILVETFPITSGVIFVYTKVATASEPTTYTFTASAAAGQTLSILNYSDAASTIFFTENATYTTGNTISTPVQPNSRVFYVAAQGNNNVDSWTLGRLLTQVASTAAADPSHIIATSNLLFDVTTAQTVATPHSIAASGASSVALLHGVVIPSGQRVTFDATSLTTAVSNSDWVTTTRTVIAGQANTTLYVRSPDIQISLDNVNWVTNLVASVGTTVHIRSRVSSALNLVNGVQSLFVYYFDDEIAFTYNLNANTQLSSAVTSNVNTALSFLYTDTTRTVTTYETDTISVTGTGGEIRKNSESWGTTVDVVTGDTITVRGTSSATRDVIRTVNVRSARSNGVLYQVNTNTVSYTAYVSGFSATFTVPLGVTSISIACVGGGGGGVLTSATTSGGGGGGGALSFINNVAVTPGESLSVARGGGGSVNITDGPATDGGTSSVSRGGTVLASAAGGLGGNGTTGGAGGSTGVGTTVNSGGTGANGNSASYFGGGGGAAGNITGNGANGVTQTNTAFGGAGGAGRITTSTTWSTNAGLTGSTAGGSSGAAAGGGGGGGTGNGTGTTGAFGGSGGSGHVAIIWNGRTFSSATTF